MRLIAIVNFSKPKRNIKFTIKLYKFNTCYAA